MITVAVASYNHEIYAEECLESICNQNYSELELCWVDDCSKDETSELVKSLLGKRRYVKRFKKIKFRSNTHNRGAAYSLNLAVRLGGGNIVSLMNSDDYYHSDRLDRIISTFAGENYWFAFSNVSPVGPLGEPMFMDPTGEHVAFDGEILVEQFGGISNSLLNRQIASSTGNFMFTRALFDAIGGFEDLRYCHDWLFALAASTLCEPNFVLDRLYSYRLHPTNSFRALGSVAEEETHYVLGEFFRLLAFIDPLNPSCPCPRRAPAKFWEIVEATGTRAFAERAFFPYLSGSRLLSI